jgi:hypothetical protein
MSGKSFVSGIEAFSSTATLLCAMLPRGSPLIDKLVEPRKPLR